MWPTFIIFLGSLAEFRQKNAGKKAGAAKEKEEKKKRKLEELSHDGGGGEKVENEDDQAGTGHAWAKTLIFLFTSWFVRGKDKLYFNLFS